MTDGAEAAGRGHALVISPTPTHPADYGNRNRVRQMTAALAGWGYAVDFVLYPIDDDWQGTVPAALADMQRAWNSVTIVAPSRPLHAPPLGVDHAIDEWWDPALERQLAWLVARRRYAVMMVHYAFLSRALTLASPGCVRVLDTHDRLTDRRALFEAHGAPAEFFHTTAGQERIALERADVVVAIKESEAAAFRAETDGPVVTLPFLPEAQTGPLPAPGATPRLRAGFIGADNRVNALNLRRFLTRLACYRRLFLPDLDIVVAGRVGRHVPDGEGIVKLGQVGDVGEFYAAVDLVVAPLGFSTGLKIKVGEALARGAAVVATADGFDGYPAADPFHALADIDAVCAALMELAADRARLARLRAASAHAAAGARAAVASGMAALARALAGRRQRLVVVTDVMWWRGGTVAEERCRQTIAFLGQAAPVLVIAATEKSPESAAPDGDVITIGPLTGLRLERRVVRELQRVASRETVLAVWQSLAHRPTRLALSAFSGAVPILLDPWPHAARVTASPGACDLDLDGRRVAALPLRHLPPSLGRVVAERSAIRPLLVLAETRADGLDTLRAGLAARLRRAGGARRVAVVRTADLAGDPALFSRLAAAPSPVAIVTVEMAPLGREIADSLGRACGAAVFHLGGLLYPQLAPSLNGGSAPVADAFAHAAAIAAWLPAAPPTAASELSDDAGWSLVWRHVARLGRAARPADSVQLVAGPRCGRDDVDLLTTA